MKDKVYASRHMYEFRVTTSVLEEIRYTIGAEPPETGGPLGGSRKDSVVRHFHLDDSSQRTSATYSPDDRYLNELFRASWNPQGIHLLGFVHSHPYSVQAPSDGDLRYAHRILQAIPDLKLLYLPIVLSKSGMGEYRLLPFAGVRDGSRTRIVSLELVSTDDLETCRDRLLRLADPRLWEHSTGSSMQALLPDLLSAARSVAYVLSHAGDTAVYQAVAWLIVKSPNRVRRQLYQSLSDLWTTNERLVWAYISLGLALSLDRPNSLQSVQKGYDGWQSWQQAVEQVATGTALAARINHPIDPESICNRPLFACALATLPGQRTLELPDEMQYQILDAYDRWLKLLLSDRYAQ